MRTKGYSTYRGRSPLKTFLKIFAVLIVIAAILAVAAVIYLQQFLVFSEDGVSLELPPFLQWLVNGSEDKEDPEEPEETETPEIPSVLDPDVLDNLDLPPVETVTPTQKPEPENQALSPVSLPLEALYDGTAAYQIETAGGDCALFDMKADSGQLGYVSILEQAAQVSSSEHAVNAAIQQLNQAEGMYTIARVSCFKDHATGNSKSFAILTNSGYIWTDPDKVRWISPTNADVRDYVTSICEELAALGFDEIVLDNAGYPNQGNLHYIKKGDAYNADQFSTVIGGFYNQVQAALAGYDVKLSVAVTQEAMDGADTLTGQTPENLAGFARLWMRDENGVLRPQGAATP